MSARPRSVPATLGLIGAAIGIGFTLGPPIGGLLAGNDPADREFRGAGVVSACAESAGDPAGALRAARESSPPSVAGPSRGPGAAPCVLLLARPGLGLLAAATLVVTYSQAVLESIFAIWALHAIGFGPRTVGLPAVWCGLPALLMQGGGVRVLAPRWARRGSRRAVCLSTSPAWSPSRSRRCSPITGVGLALCGLGVGRLQPERLVARLAIRAERPWRGDGNVYRAAVWRESSGRSSPVRSIALGRRRRAVSGRRLCHAAGGLARFVAQVAVRRRRAARAATSIVPSTMRTGCVEAQRSAGGPSTRPSRISKEAPCSGQTRRVARSRPSHRRACAWVQMLSRANRPRGCDRSRSRVRQACTPACSLRNLGRACRHRRKSVIYLPKAVISVSKIDTAWPMIQTPASAVREFQLDLDPAGAVQRVALDALKRARSLAAGQQAVLRQVARRADRARCR